MKNRKVLGLMLAAAASNHYYDNLYRTQRETMSLNSNYKVKKQNKVLREFNIKGEKIYAYSRKDAIKRLKHKK